MIAFSFWHNIFLSLEFLHLLCILCTYHQSNPQTPPLLYKSPLNMFIFIRCSQNFIYLIHLSQSFLTCQVAYRPTTQMSSWVLHCHHENVLCFCIKPCVFLLGLNLHFGGVPLSIVSFTECIRNMFCGFIYLNIILNSIFTPFWGRGRVSWLLNSGLKTVSSQH